MNAHVYKEELELLPTDRISYPEHYADAAHRSATKTGLVARFRAWMERRNAIAELSSLTDRELADIGVVRDELARVFEPGYVVRR